MKIIRLLQLVAKFGAYIMVAIDIVEFAIEKITPLLGEKKEVKNDN